MTTAARGRATALFLLAAAVLAASGCSQGGNEGASPSPPSGSSSSASSPDGPGGPHVVRGTLRDAATGKPVPRTGLYVHLFCDDLKFQHTLPDSDASDFRAGMPGPKVRIRIHDPGKMWAFHEETITVEKGEAVLDVNLRRTGFIILKGRVMDGRTGEPIRLVPKAGTPAPGGGPLLSFFCEDPKFSEHHVVPDGNGRYAVRVPRGRITFGAIDTALSPAVPGIDLTGETGESREFDIVLR